MAGPRPNLSELHKKSNQDSDKQRRAQRASTASKAIAAEVLKEPITHRSITQDVLQALREELTAVNNKGTPYYRLFAKAFLDEALHDPNSQPARMIANGLFSERMLAKLDTEAAQAMSKETAFSVYQLRKSLFDKQTEVFDNDKDKKIMVICGRRSGKTEMNARRLVKELLVPNTPVLYLNRTFDNAIKQLYDIVMEQIGVVELPVAKSSKVDGTIELTNGSLVKFGGVNDISQIDKYRGFKFKLVIIDEVGHLKNTQYLIDEVLTPATMDYQNSQMIFTGTPPRVKNYATRLWHSNIKKYHWTASDNPFITNFEPFIELVCKEKGLTKEDPYIQREYFGNMEAYDTDALVCRNFLTYDKIPKDHIPTSVYIGVDWGFVDNNAIIMISVDSVRKRAYVVYQDCFNRAGDEEVKAAIQKAYLMATEIMNSSKNIHIVTDTDKPGLAYDLYKKLKLPVEKAYKYDLSSSVAETASLMRTKVYIPSSSPDDGAIEGNYHNNGNMLAYEADRIVYKRDEETDTLLPEIDDGAFHPNAFHALRYALRNATQDWPDVEAATVLKVDDTIPKGLESVKEMGRSTLPPWMTKQEEAFVI